MRTTLIRTVPRDKTNALAYQGILPCERYSQIRDTLSRHFDARYVAPFAEPVFNKNEGFIDWYVPFTGTVRAYTELSLDEKERVSKELAEIARSIRSYAQELIDSGDPQKNTRGNILLLALCYPSEEDIFLVDETPVVTCWGFAPGTQEAPQCNLCDLRVRQAKIPEPPKVEAVPPSPPPPPPPVVEEKKGALGLWLLPLCLLLALLLVLLLFADFGQQKALSGTTLLTLPSLNASDEERLDTISRSVAEQENVRKDLEAKAMAHIAQCRPKKAPVAKKPPEKKEALVIPKNVQDASFLKGRWLCETGLFNSSTGVPVKVEFVFDSKGSGLGRIYEPNDTCSGKARAKYEKGVLHIEHDALRCTKKDGVYTANSIECRNTPLTGTECLGRSPVGDPWNALFFRLQEEERP